MLCEFFFSKKKSWLHCSPETVTTLVIVYSSIQNKKFKKKKERELGFSGGSVVKNLPANAGFNPWSRKIPRVMEQLSLCATTIEPVL